MNKEHSLCGDYLYPTTITIGTNGFRLREYYKEELFSQKSVLYKNVYAISNIRINDKREYNWFSIECVPIETQKLDSIKIRIENGHEIYNLLIKGFKDSCYEKNNILGIYSDSK